MVSDLNKNFGGSTDLVKKRHGSADLHTPIHPPRRRRQVISGGGGWVRTPCTLPLDPPLLVNLSKSEAIVLVILLTRLRIDLSSGVNPLEQLYVLIAFVDLWFQSRQIAQSLSGQILLGIDKSLNRGTENFVQSTLFIRGNTRINRMEFVCANNKRAHDYICAFSL